MEVKKENRNSDKKGK